MAKSGDQTKTEQQQSTQTNPWEPTQPLLKNLVSDYSAIDPSVTAGQTAALQNLQNSASAIPNFGATGAGAVNNLFNSSTTPQVGMLKDAFAGLNTNLGATASGANLDPYSTPGFGDALKTLTSDITNSVKGVYNGSGRDPAGAGSFAGSLGRGLMQGEAPVVQAEADRLRGEQQGAAGTLYNAGNTTAGQITGQNQVPLTNAVTGLNSAGMLSNLFTNPAATQLAAANTAYGQPLSNLGALQAPVAQIAGLGGSSSGQSTGTTTQVPSTMSNIMGGISGGIGMLSFLSDVRAKEDIEPVGKLDDGQTVHKFRYKGDPRVHIGLLAQEVASHVPGAVERHPGGMLMVNYDAATKRAAIHRRTA